VSRTDHQAQPSGELEKTRYLLRLKVTVGMIIHSLVYRSFICKCLCLEATLSCCHSLLACSVLECWWLSLVVLDLSVYQFAVITGPACSKTLLTNTPVEVCSWLLLLLLLLLQVHQNSQ
jgi:hypothetical protein